jgi:hypothetical protein
VTRMPIDGVDLTAGHNSELRNWRKTAPPPFILIRFKSHFNREMRNKIATSCAHKPSLDE